MNFDEWICFGIPEDISQDACAWLAKLDGGNLSLSEQTEFYTWLALDPQHQWAFEELTELWAKTALLDNLKFEYVPNSSFMWYCFNSSLEKIINFLGL